MSVPRIAVTMGDPAGVGPELCLKLLADREIAKLCTPIVLGDASVLAGVANLVNLPMSAKVFSLDRFRDECSELDQPAVVDFGLLNFDEVRPGQVAAATGLASYRYVERAIEAALADDVAAICTAPINKEALHAAGINYPGHTEILADLTGTKSVVMMLTSNEITCSLVTAHVPLAEVPKLLNAGRISETIWLTAEVMRRLRGREPRLIVCGLNPHASEHGLFGHEESRSIEPAVAAARAIGIDVEGPLPPDTAFLPARRAVTDAYICMYHDQGLIPLKMLAFDTGINITLGLPILRTSVDHGTAFDIAWQGKASATSLFEAMRLAARLVGQGKS
jgi:4-hydroxythreonine-4-phosphate dehydrogenase